MFGYKLIKKKEYEGLISQILYKDSEIYNLKYNNYDTGYKNMIYLKIAEFIKLKDDKLFNSLYKKIAKEYPKQNKEDFLKMFK